MTPSRYLSRRAGHGPAGRTQQNEHPAHPCHWRSVPCTFGRRMHASVHGRTGADLSRCPESRPGGCDEYLQLGDRSISGYVIRYQQLVSPFGAVQISLNVTAIWSLMQTVCTLPTFPLTVIAFSRRARSAIAVSMRKHLWIRRPA